MKPSVRVLAYDQSDDLTRKSWKRALWSVTSIPTEDAADHCNVAGILLFGILAEWSLAEKLAASMTSSVCAPPRRSTASCRH